MTAARRRDQQTPADVLIVGGGPAGSTAANLLAHDGHDVLVLEKEVFPRFHIGESLLPIDLPIFERLGMKLDTPGYLRKDGAEFIDERTRRAATFVFAEALDGTPQTAYQVERSRFNHLLLQQAEPRGGSVRYGVRVEEMVVEEATVRVETRRGHVPHAIHDRRHRAGRASWPAPTGPCSRSRASAASRVFRHYDGIAPNLRRAERRPGTSRC